MDAVLAGAVDALLYAVGAALLVWLVRRVRPELPRGAGAAYAALVFAFFAAALTTPLTQVGTDIAYQWRPWSEAVAEPVEMDNPLLSDIPLQMLPFRTLVRDRLLAGELPLWAHELGTGQPLLGNGQSAPFAPLLLPTVPLPVLRGLTVAVAWQLLVGLLLMHALVLALARTAPEETPERLRPWGAAVAALAFAFSVYAVAWAYHPLGMVAMGVPGVVLGLVMVARGERRGLPLLVTVAVAMAVSGHPETVAHTALLSALLAVILWARRPAVGRGRFVGRLAGAAALSFLLTAPVLLPLLENLPASERMVILEKAPQAVAPSPFTWQAWLPTLQPLAFGSPRYQGAAGYDGPSNLNEYCSQYAGVLALALALAGALVLRGRVAAIVGGGLVALLLSFRVEPLYSLLELVPVLGHAAHGRLRLFWVLAVAVAAGLALPRLLATRGRRLVLAGVVALVAVGFALLPPPVAETGLAGSLHPRLWWGLALAGLVLAVVGLVGTSLGRGETTGDTGERPVPGTFPEPVPGTCPAVPGMFPASLGPLMGLALGAELFVLGVVYHPLVPPGLQLEAPPALAWIVERHEEAMAEHAPFRVLAQDWDFVPNIPAVYGLWDPRGNDPARPFDAAWLTGQRLTGHRWQRGRPSQLRSPYDTAYLQMLGVRYVLTRHRKRLGPPWMPVHDHQGGKVWELEGALPLFWVPDAVRRLDAASARAWTVGNDDFAARVAVTDTSLAGTDPTAQPLVPQEGRVYLERVRANGFDLVTESATEMVVASSVTLAPGWRVSIDGDDARPVPVSWVFLGMEVPAGVHRVRVTYSPDGWRWGIGLFGVGVVVLIGVGWRRRTRRATGPGGADHP